MDDKDVLQMLEKYKKNDLEIEKNYQIKKVKLEKEYKKQQRDNKFKLFNYLYQKEEEAKKKFENFRQIRNELFGNDEDEQIAELNNIANETRPTFENDNNSQGIQLREGTEINGMKKANINEEREEREEIEENEEKEEKERKEEKDKFEGEDEFKEKKELQMTNKKRYRPFKDDNN